MKEYRWLLPFTHGVDGKAIRLAIRLAEARGATLVPVSLIKCSEERRTAGVRLEHIQQSKDFLELVRSNAERFQVPIEGHEVFTGDVVKCISILIRDLHCDGIVVATDEQQGVLLDTDELTALVTSPPAPLVLVRLVEYQEHTPLSSIGRRFLSWLLLSWGEHKESGRASTPTVVPTAAPAREKQEQYSG